MNNKGAGSVLLIITATLGLILIASLLVPQVKNTNTQFDQVDALVYNACAAAQNVTLSQTLPVSGSLTMDGGLTLGANYTVDYDAYYVRFNASGCVNGTYNATYQYTESNYLTDATHRALIAVVILAAILGVIVFLFKGFGVMKE